MTPDNTFVVIYRTGGTDICAWHACCLGSTEEKARLSAASLERMGYRTIVRETDVHLTLGMPVGWEPALVDWRNDRIEIGVNFSRHYRNLTPEGKTKAPTKTRRRALAA